MNNPEIKKTIIDNIKNNFNLKEDEAYYEISLTVKGRFYIEAFEQNPELLITLLKHLREKASRKVDSGINFMETQLEMLEDGSKFPRLCKELNLDT